MRVSGNPGFDALHLVAYAVKLFMHRFDKRFVVGNVARSYFKSFDRNKVRLASPSVEFRSLARSLGKFNKGIFNTDDAMLNLLMKKRKKTIPKQYLIKDWNTNYRFDTKATLAMMRHSNINPSQLERLAQFIDVETRDPGNNRGIRLFAPTKECYRKKKQYVKQKFTSMKFKRVKSSALSNLPRSNPSSQSISLKRTQINCEF